MSNSTRQDAQASTAGSSTVTVTPATDVTGAGPSQPPRNTVGVLKLRGGPSRRQRVVWSDETVDNEGMGKKKSKICCIYHKPRAFDESSSESDTSDDEHVKGKGRPKKKPEVVDSSESEGGAGSGAARPRRKAHRHTHCDGPKRDANKYDAKTTK